MANNDVPATCDRTDGHAPPQQGATGDVAATPQSPQPAAPVRPRLGPEDWRATQEIAGALGESAHGALGQVGRVVGRLGAERARAFLAQAQEIEAGDGLMLPDGSRRRTPGGVFFHLVRADDNLSREDRLYIFPSQFGRNGHRKGAGGDTQPTPTPAPAVASAPQPTTWTDDDYRRVKAALQQDRGRTSIVKMTVIGRPGAAVEQGQAVVLALVSEKLPALAKGVPEPPVGTRYTIFVAPKPWAKVAEALAADPEDAAIIEGYAALDPRVEGIVVYATSATTKRLQAAKRATQPATTP